MSVKAYILATTKMGGEYEVLEYVLRISTSNVKIEADVVYGAFDLVIIVEAPDFSSLDEIVTKIRKHPKIVKTMTLVSSRTR